MPSQPQVLHSDAVLVVASQQLIAAFPRQNDFDVPAGKFRNKVQRHAGWMRNRFVLLIDERWKLTEELLGRDDNFVMIRLESLALQRVRNSAHWLPVRRRPPKMS